MKINDIFNEKLYEARRNPEMNPRENFMEKLLEYSDDDSLFIHTTTADKVGVNPKSSKTSTHDTPTGVYTFHLKTYQEHIKRSIEHDIKNLTSIFPFFGGNTIYIIKSKEPFEDTLKTFTEDDLKLAIELLKRKYTDEEVDQALAVAPSNENYVNAPIGKLWGMTKALAIGGTSELSHQQYPDSSTWNKLLRYVGLDAIHDVGYGFIHGAEASQSVFLTTNSYTVVDKMVVSRKQSTTTIGGKEYRGGRLPKNLILTSIDDTELYNMEYSPNHDKVKTITIQRVRERDIRSIKRLKGLFPKSDITIGMIVLENPSLFEGKKARELDILRKVQIDKMVFTTVVPSLGSEIDALSSLAGNINHIMYTPQTLMKHRRPLDLDKFPENIRNKMSEYS